MVQVFMHQIVIELKTKQTNKNRTGIPHNSSCGKRSKIWFIMRKCLLTESPQTGCEYHPHLAKTRRVLIWKLWPKPIYYQDVVLATHSHPHPEVLFVLPRPHSATCAPMKTQPGGSCPSSYMPVAWHTSSPKVAYTSTDTLLLFALSLATALMSVIMSV